MIRILKNGLLLAVFCALSLMVQGMMTGTVAHAAYDLTQTSLRYSSSGSNGDESTFILSYESVPHYGVYANRAPHGEYLVHNDIDGGTNDFSYDYDGFGSPTGIYIKWSDREFHTEDDSTQIIKYITDGMLIFKNQCLH